MRLRNPEAGLTLLELTVAMAITAVVVVILLSALRMGQRSRQKGEERVEVSQRMRIVTDRVTWLLRGAYPYVATDEDGEKILYFTGSETGVGFVTTSLDPYNDTLENLPGLKWVSLFTDDGGLKVREHIFYDPEALEDTGGVEYVLDPSVENLSFEYLGRDEETEGDVWSTSWDENSLPEAVKVDLALRYQDRLISVPPFTVVLRARGEPLPEQEQQP